MPKATVDEIQDAQFEIGLALDRVNASPTAAASALASLLMDIFVELLKDGDSKVAGEMRRMAHRLQLIANESPTTVVRRAIELADERGESKS